LGIKRAGLSPNTIIERVVNGAVAVMRTKSDNLNGITRLLLTAAYLVSFLALRVPLGHRWAHMSVYQHAGVGALISCYLGVCILLWVRKLDSQTLLLFVTAGLALMMVARVLLN
jgi:hypothetical protein